MCTIPDVTYLAEHWGRDNYGSAPHEYHETEFDVSYAKVVDAFKRIEDRFAQDAAANADFDGGLLNFCFSGHGREGDGALCLADETTFNADDFIAACMRIRRAAPGMGRLRVALLLDSCYSGAFILRALELMLHEYPEELVPEYLLASSMPDEESYEVPALGHGLSTFCWSLKVEPPESVIGTAHGLPGFTWSIAEGPDGCSIVTGGQQNPIKYDTYELETAFGSVPVWEGDVAESKPRSRDEWERDLRAHRDSLADAFALLRKRSGIVIRKKTTPATDETASAGD
jgi:hypothetical protein